MSRPEPRFETLTVDPARRDDGVILLAIGYNTRSIHKTSDRELLVALGPDGRVVWQRDLPQALMDCRASGRETLLAVTAGGCLQELDRTGALVGEWYPALLYPDGIPEHPQAIPLPTLKLHHAATELPDGRLATLSVRLMRGVNDNPEFPDSMADTIIVFDRDGTVEREVALDELLDHDRRSHSHYLPYWPLQGFDGVADWTHANGLSVDPLDGGFIVSLRHQDAVIKVSRQGDLVWILSEPDWAEPWSERVLVVDGGRPFYHQHDAAFTDDGVLLLFDNGNHGSRPPTPSQPVDELSTYALGYRIDEGAMTATEEWRYGGRDIAHSTYVGGVTQTPNGNRFIACTGIKREPDGSYSPSTPDGIGSVECYEVTPEGDLVFHTRLVDPAAGPDQGWNGFRPQYLPAGYLR
ncbi:MAG: aryl-sulfate sulfotransferase [Actinomycetota bacterium]